MKIELNLFGNNPIYETFSEGSERFPLSRVLLQACLDRGVSVVYEGKYEKVNAELNFAHIVITPTKEETSATAYIYGYQEDRSLIGSPQDVATSIAAEILIYLSSEEFSRLFLDKPKIINSQLQFSVDGNEIFLSDGSGVNLIGKLDHLQVRVTDEISPPRGIVGELEGVYRKQIRGNLKARYGQLAGICQQFAESLATGQAKIQATTPLDVDKCREIIDIARQAFTVEEVSASDKDAKDIWKHQDIVGMIQYGDGQKKEQLAGFNPNAYEIEGLANKLLSLDVAKSKILEDCILDALVFSETIAFARIFYSKKKILGMRMSEPLKGTEDESLFIGLSKVLGQGLAFYAKEILFIAITYGVAFMLAAGDVTAAWVITSVFTAFRWYYKEQTSKDDPKYKGAILLNKMIGFYAAVDQNQDRVNPEILKRKLIDLEMDGAVYSRSVYEIIDRKISMASSR